MTLPRLLQGATAAPMTYAHHRRVHGELWGAARAGELLAEIKRSGLRGRGGAAFPLAIKVDAVRRSRRTPILLANGCEGEPMSVKDRLLIATLPHLVIDGALALARAIGAGETLFAVDELSVRAGEALQRALSERPDLDHARLQPEIIWAPPGFITGQESALVRWCNEGIAKPSSVPPRVTERGIAGRPTLVCNVETLAHVALIARHGADWFAALGSADDPGSALVTLSGSVRRPGVYEIAHGSSLGSLLTAADGPSEPTRAFLLGGYAGSWIDSADGPRIRLSRGELRPFRARLGSGIVVALPRTACPVAETTRIAGWLADQSSGQCGPCTHGLAAIADDLHGLCEGSAGPDGLYRVSRWCELASGRGACAHPDGTASFVTSALRVFADEFSDHAQHGPCDACEQPPVLRLPGQLSGTV
ncbi:MAG: NADH-ubiquinone oxidoreductase-F iron-sulfur binding region domain-containing protein [Solirubrobacteraceae bacterium]